MTVSPAIRRILLAAAAVGLAAPATAREVRVYNWSDYIDEQILKDFQNETGIKVVYDVFDSNEILEAKLVTGGTGYDVVVPTATFLSRQIKANVFQKLDKSKLPNLKNMWPDIAERAAKYDPGNLYSVNYMWGTTGVGYNAEKIKALVKDAPFGSWKLVYDPEVVKSITCGVMLLDSPEDLLPSVMNYLGLEPDMNNPESIEKASAHLAKITPYVTKYHSSEYISALANGDICLAVGYSGDILQAASDAGEGITVDYAIPQEGAQLWFDQMAIPADAPNPEEAHVFINYMMKPEVIAKASNVTSYANGNLASKEFLDESVLDDPRVYPDEEVVKRLFTVATVEDPKIQRTITRAWTRAKSGS
jgi:putrescine transport system substrate-binding protein